MYISYCLQDNHFSLSPHHHCLVCCLLFLFFYCPLMEASHLLISEDKNKCYFLVSHRQLKFFHIWTLSPFLLSCIFEGRTSLCSLSRFTDTIPSGVSEVPVCMCLCGEEIFRGQISCHYPYVTFLHKHTCTKQSERMIVLANSKWKIKRA